METSNLLILMSAFFSLRALQKFQNILLDAKLDTLIFNFSQTHMWQRLFFTAYFLQLHSCIRLKNIARGTTDPWVDTITGGTLRLANLVNRWHHMHMLEIQPQSGTTCISKKFGHQMAPFALVRNLANMWLNFQQMHVVPSVY